MNLIDKYLGEANMFEPIKQITLLNKQKFSKMISLSKHRNGSFEITVNTESPAPTSVTGVKSSLSRTKFKADEEEKANKAFDKKVAFATKKGWKKK
jgi:hypothetical protein